MKLKNLMLGLLLGAAAITAQAAADEGQPAPEFKLQDQNSKWHTLADHKGKWVVLYFYPKDDTPGCTTQACEFRDHVFKIRAAGAEVIGVSLDDVKSHAEFAAKHKLPFPLLADTEAKAAEAYEVLGGMPGVRWAKRVTFLISPEGRIARRYDGVDPKKNALEVLAEIEQRKKSAAKPSA